MTIGEKSRFILSPDYTTGIEKVFDISPKKSSLIFEIELLKIIEPIKKISDMTYEEKLLEAKKLKIKGVEKFKIKDIAAARDLFERSATYLESIEKIKEVEAEGVNLYAVILSNLCICYNQLKEYQYIIKIANKGLKIKELPKFYYFRAIAYIFIMMKLI